MINLILAVALSAIQPTPIAIYESKSLTVLLFEEQGEYCSKGYRRALVNEQEACYAETDFKGTPFYIVGTQQVKVAINALNFVYLGRNDSGEK
jgi:hypothetical protein